MNKLLRIEPYTRKDGKQTQVAVWESACATCGAPFEQKSPIWRPHPLANCPAHRGVRTDAQRELNANPTPAMIAARKSWGARVQAASGRSSR